MITTEVSSVSYSGNNSTEQVYPIPFPFLEKSHIKCEVTDSSGTVTTLTDFSVVASKDGEGRNVSGEVLTASAIATSSTIRFFRETPAIQTLDLVAGGSLPAEAAETAFDRATMIAQEARRDAAYSGDSNITAAETGLVSQVSAGSFVGRTISPGSNSPLTVTNGNGVDGNPTIDFNDSGLESAISVADADTFLVNSGGTFKKVAKSVLVESLVDQTFETVNIPASQLIADQTSGPVIGALSGRPIDEIVAKFAGDQTRTAYLRWFTPSDYSGGLLKVRLFYYGTATSLTVNASWNIKVNNDWQQNIQEGGSVDDLDTAFDDTVTEYSVSDTAPGRFGTVLMTGRSPAISIGSGYTAGAPLMIQLERDWSIGHGEFALMGLQIQYPKQAAMAAWT